MKRTFLPIAILLFIISCRKEPVLDEKVEPIADTSEWHKSDPGIGAVFNFYFLSAAKGFSASREGMYRTLDSGKTWSRVDTGIEAGVQDIFFFDQQHGYAVGIKNFGVTSDGGASWVFKELEFSDDIQRVFFLSASTGFITSDYGLYKTKDGGTTWVQVNKKDCVGICFKNEMEGWVSSAKAGSLLKTTDGGATFEYVPSTGNTRPYTIMFTDSLHGWANTGSSPRMLKTADGGISWDNVPVNGPLEGSIEVQFLNNTVGYIATGETIIKTTDGGNTWNEILKAKETISIIEMFFIDENTGWANDSDGNLYRLRK